MDPSDVEATSGFVLLKRVSISSWYHDDAPSCILYSVFDSRLLFHSSAVTETSLPHHLIELCGYLIAPLKTDAVK